MDNHKGKIKAPVSGKVAKVPVVMQMEALECGAASLAMVLAYYNRWIPLEQVRLDCGVSRDGSNAKNILVAARNYGLDAKGYRYEPEFLRESGIFPCIIHWNFNHFVVLCGFKGNKVYINDPARGNIVLSMEEFDRSFTGICMEFEPTEAFKPGGKPKGMIKYAAERLKGTGPAVMFTIATTVIVSMFGMIYPAFKRVFMDQILTGYNPAWIWPFLIGISIVSLLEIYISFLQTVHMLKIDGKLAVVGSTSYMWKVLSLPMEFFSQRMAGDILIRLKSNATIASTLVQTFAPLFINSIMMAFYFVVMLRYNVILSAVGILSIFINLFCARFISKKRVNITRVMQRDAGKLEGTTVAGIEMIETIKASGAENGFFEKWAGYQASVNAANVKFDKINQYFGMIPNVVSAMANALVLFIGVFFVITGDFTIGMVMAFQAILQQFSSPATQLITTGQTLQEMRTDMERLEDVMKYPSKEITEVSAHNEDESFSKLSGRLEMRNVTFGYSRLAEPLIRDFNLTLEQGSRVAFVGGSGCGKSTLAKLISGLYSPWSGDILFDGRSIGDIDHAIFTGSLAVVDQDIILFEDTISDNIKMWDRSIEDFEMIMAARDASIHEDVMMRDGGYRYKMIEGGKDFSGGQRQRLEIARVLAQDPTIIILDEATSALDAKTEYEVVKAIKDRGITCIVVAHRLSTIRDCDEIIVLDRGKVVERGTHDELMAKNGHYVELVTSE